MKRTLLLACHVCLAAALKFNEAPPATAAEGEVKQLIQRIQEADRGAVKQLFAEILRRGGQKHLEDVLAKFAAQGYNYNVLLEWLAGSWELGKDAIQLKQDDDHGFKLLLEGLKASNKTTVREAFGRMLRGGGPAFMAKKLQELQSMGYVIDDIKQWYTSKDSAPSDASGGGSASTATSPKVATGAEDARELIKFLKSQDQGALRIKITEIYHHGGDPRIHRALEAVKAQGVDPKEVELLAAGKVKKAPAPHADTTPAPASPVAEEALELLKSIAQGDRSGAKKELSSILVRRGLTELEEVLRRASFRGHDAKQIQDWISEAEPQSPAAKLRLARQEGASPTTSTASTAPQASTVPATVVAAMPAVPSTMSSTMAPVAPSSMSSEVPLEPPATDDTEQLVLRLRDGDRRGAAEGLAKMLAAGGQRRIQKALGGLKLWGYDPGRFQQWVAEGVPGLLVGKATERENTMMAMVEALKKWDRSKASQLMEQVFRKGGPSKVQELLNDLKSMGYSPSEVEKWIYAKPPATTALPADHVSDVTALAAESKAQKVKVLGVQDFRIAVSDLSTAKLAEA